MSYLLPKGPLLSPPWKVKISKKVKIFTWHVLHEWRGHLGLLRKAFFFCVAPTMVCSLLEVGRGPQSCFMGLSLSLLLWGQLFRTLEVVLVVTWDLVLFLRKFSWVLFTIKEDFCGRLAFFVTLWGIWLERNNGIFGWAVRFVGELWEAIRFNLSLWLAVDWTYFFLLDIVLLDWNQLVLGGFW